MGGWLGRCLDGWTDGGWLDERMDGQMEVTIFLCLFLLTTTGISMKLFTDDKYSANTLEVFHAT